jgi:hypothetical protein
MVATAVLETGKILARCTATISRINTLAKSFTV